MLVRAEKKPRSNERGFGCERGFEIYFFGETPGTVIRGESSVFGAAAGAAGVAAGAVAGAADVAGRSLFTSRDTSSVMS